MEGHEMNNT